ncbi:MAG: protein-tyrosine-phosphatase [Polaribacter sp.]|nr:MAG: protein-tyrosine-phosphatase [Polaribacter sp.]
MKKILMVCLGNICRSPLAEGILKSKIDTNKIFVDSAGTAGYHKGELPDSRSIAVAEKYGIDITNQRSRQFQIFDFDTFDIIYAMDNSNYDNIVKLARNKSDIQKVKLILNEISNENLNVPDPYYGGTNGFEDVFQMLDEACDIIASKI